MNSRTAAEGRYPRTVLGTVCVPWTDEHTLDEPRFRAAITQLARDIPRLYIFGSAGEGHAVTDTQYRRVLDVFVDQMAVVGAAPPMVGVISPSLGTVIDRIAYGESAGVRSFQVSLPSWGALTDEEVDTFFAEVCDRFTDSEFLHYNVGSAGRLVSPTQYGALAERHPNLVATKYGGGDPAILTGLMAEAPQLRHFLSEQGYLLASAIGEPGLLTSASSANPVRANDYLQAGIDGDRATLQTMAAELAEVTRCLLAALGSGRSAAAYDKALLKLTIPDFPLTVLPPYSPATHEQFTTLRDDLVRTTPHWLPAA